MDDANIIFLLHQRSEQAVEAIQKKYGSAMLSTARGICGSKEDAEEVVNDALAGIWDSPPASASDSLTAYLFRIVRNQALNRVRQRGTQKRSGIVLPLDELAETLTENSPEDTDADRAELSAAINGFLSGLDSTSRIIFVRRYWYSDTVTDIAHRLGMTSNAVSLRLSRLRAALGRHLKKEGICL